MAFVVSFHLPIQFNLNWSRKVSAFRNLFGYFSLDERKIEKYSSSMTLQTQILGYYEPKTFSLIFLNTRNHFKS